MRPLTEVETRTLFDKLASYIGRNIVHLIDRPDDPHCFRLQKDRVYYVSERIMKIAISVSRENLVSLGTPIGYVTVSALARSLTFLESFPKLANSACM